MQVHGDSDPLSKPAFWMPFGGGGGEEEDDEDGGVLGVLDGDVLGEEELDEDGGVVGEDELDEVGGVVADEEDEGGGPVGLWDAVPLSADTALLNRVAPGSRSFSENIIAPARPLHCR